MPINLSVKNFPYPYLNEDMKFTHSYDKLIVRWQSELIEFLIDHLDKNCKQMLENEINEISEALVRTKATGSIIPLTQDEVSIQTSEIYDLETRKLQKQFDRAEENACNIKKLSFADLLRKKLKKRREIRIRLKQAEIERVDIKF